MNKINMLIAFTSISILYGCTSTSPKDIAYQPPTYDPAHSRAYNLAHAGGLVTGIGDATIPSNQSASGLKDLAFGAGVAMNPQFGLTSVEGGLLGFAAAVLGPDEQGERNSFFGWLPKSSSNSQGDAQEIVLEQAKNSIMQAIVDIGGKVNKKDDGTTDFARVKNVLAVGLLADQYNCHHPTDKIKGCAIGVVVQLPTAGHAPNNSGITGESFAFTSGSSPYNKFFISAGDDNKIPEDKLYAAISKHLPKGMFIYLAPRKVKLADGSKSKFPYILDQGKPELFVVPKA